MDRQTLIDFVQKLNFWQAVHILMADEYLDNPNMSREDAYEKAADYACDTDYVVSALSKIINFGSYFH